MPPRKKKSGKSKTSGKPIRIFCSYAHEDKKIVEDVRKQLELFQYRKEIKVWSDREISPGERWNRQIDERLRKAQIILLFVSSDFFNSPFCYDVEMAQAIQMDDEGRARVIPVIARPCAWRHSPVEPFQALPSNARPLTQWSDRDEACLDVAEGVMKVVRDLNGGQSPGRTTSAVRPATTPRGTSHRRQSTMQSIDDYIATLPGALQEKVNILMKADKHDWDSDPNGDHFGRAPREARGRRLDVEIVDRHQKRALELRVRVSRVRGSRLSDPVLLLKHQTYDEQRAELLFPVSDFVETEMISEDWFTVAAIADGGRTVLSYSLKKLPGAPQWFRKG